MWPGADKCYNRMQNILHQMAQRGHAKICRQRCKGLARPQHCHVSQEMNDAIAMLGRFQEEPIKAFIMVMRDRGYDPDLDWRA
jgi:hypothetical protein